MSSSLSPGSSASSSFFPRTGTSSSLSPGPVMLPSSSLLFGTLFSLSCSSDTSSSSSPSPQCIVHLATRLQRILLHV
eukprot:CAMPEP_0172560036 /NCGR_PEP_ID=MMETSP1067-20121228/86871_1 /TAXON_ID=265564 ORGANISM="Thalassiosira punctigera, Strain Tpunct2005C2" /NCGR_SAMPLE_ID=MMETSP1067 /ASSEMBLY_ACC=CAM_ASM_000444 /LENGTH=76 /DNA_ID=CAMNT_0013349763 /DNA_START=85 /DNA_END=312 /DNA_ORIENTATION=+